MRMVQNNSGLWCQRKTIQFRFENENSELQMWDKYGHVVISAVCRKRNSFQTRCRYWHLRVMLDCVIYCVTRNHIENDVITTPQGFELSNFRLTFRLHFTICPENLSLKA